MVLPLNYARSGVVFLNLRKCNTVPGSFDRFKLKSLLKGIGSKGSCGSLAHTAEGSLY